MPKQQRLHTCFRCTPACDHTRPGGLQQLLLGREAHREHGGAEFQGLSQPQQGNVTVQSALVKTWVYKMLLDWPFLGKQRHFLKGLGM